MNIHELYSDIKVKFDNLKRQYTALQAENKQLLQENQNLKISEDYIKKGIVPLGDGIFMIEKCKVPGYGYYVSAKKYNQVVKALEQCHQK